MSAVIGIVTCSMLVFMIAFALTGYAYKRRKLCFKETNTPIKGKPRSKKKTSSRKVIINIMYLL